MKRYQIFTEGKHFIVKAIALSKVDKMVLVCAVDGNKFQSNYLTKWVPVGELQLTNVIPYDFRDDCELVSIYSLVI